MEEKKKNFCAMRQFMAMSKCNTQVKSTFWESSKEESITLCPEVWPHKYSPLQKLSTAQPCRTQRDFPGEKFFVLEYNFTSSRGLWSVYLVLWNLFNFKYNWKYIPIVIGQLQVKAEIITKGIFIC